MVAYAEWRSVYINCVSASNSLVIDLMLNTVTCSYDSGSVLRHRLQSLASIKESMFLELVLA